MNLRDIKVDIRTVAAIVMGCFAVYFWLEGRYAYNSYVQREVLSLKKGDLQLKQQELENEINRDHFARRQYERDIAAGKATETDLVRHDYLLMEIDSKLSEKAIVEEQLGKFKVEE